MLRRLHVASLLLLPVWFSIARGEHLFQWTWSNFVQDGFTECQMLQIVVESLYPNSTYTGVPPYYLIAFEAGGVPTTTMIGNDPTHLSWQVTHQRGSSLMLTILDSNASTGGVPSLMYNVTAGSDTSCLPSAPSTSSLARITPNITTSIETCEPWGLTVLGGKKPYQVVLSALNSGTITNVTMGVNDDVFTYIDRAVPNELLMASVVDANGQWGVSSSTVLPTGSQDTDCVGLVSTSQTSAQIAQEAANRAKAEHDAQERHKHLVLGLCVGLAVPAAAGLAVGLWWFLKRRAERGRGTWDDGQDVTPRAWNLPYTDAGVEMQEGNATGQPLLSSKVSEVNTYHPVGSPHLEITPIPPVYFDREIRRAQEVDSACGSSSNPASPQPSTSFTPGTDSSARPRKVLEARQESYTTARLSRSSPAVSRASPGVSSPSPLPPALIDTSLDPNIQPDIIIQHRDGGTGIVHELPPPYADRTILKPISPSPTSPTSGSSPSHEASSS